MFHVKHSFYLAYFLKFVYYNLDATDIVESGQDWKIAALTLNICVHLFLGVNMDNFYMTEALKLARKAFKAGEVPIGAIIVDNNRIIGKGYNQKEKQNSKQNADNPILHTVTSCLCANILKFESPIFTTKGF